MRPTLRLVLLTALRDRLFYSLFGLIAVALGVATYLGGAAVFEKLEMTAVYAAGAARAMVVVGLIVFVAFHVERLYDTREIEAILSRAISREKFVFTYWAAMAFVASLILAPIVALVLMISPSTAGAAYWGASLALETMIVIAFAVFAGCTLERAIPTIFASVGFYLMSRMMSFFVAIATSGDPVGLDHVTDTIIEAIALLAPRLDLFAQTRWIVYGSDGSDVTLLLIAQATVYVPLLLSAAMFDLRRKHF
jgi:ABC-type transport system involved in multi-copper enzyme maturation permease subunit